ncbi:cytochrome D1 domain-containing protein [Blastococcus sp. SYSU D00669]
MFRRRVGPFQLVSLLGTGDHGEVYRALDTRSDRWVALTLFAPALARDARRVAAFRSTALAAARLGRHGVVPADEVGELGGRLYAVSRLVDGVDLGRVLADGGPLPPARAVEVVARAAAALDAVHAAGLVHLGVQPGTLLLTADDGVLLTGLGVAGLRTAWEDAGPAALATTAPERFSGGPVDARADVYALACVLHTCLSGRAPFAGTDLAAQLDAHLHLEQPRAATTVDGVPPALDAVVRRGMAKRPEDRFATAGALASAAAEALLVPEHALVGAGRVGAPDRPSPRPRRLPAPRAVPPGLLRPAPTDRPPRPPEPVLVPLPATRPSARRRSLAVAAGLLVVAAGTAGVVRASAGDPVPAVAESSARPTVVATVDVGVSPASVEFSPDGSTAYVTGRGRDLWVLDAGGHSFTGTLDVPDGPAWYVALSPDGGTAYVSVKDSEQIVHRLVALDTATGEVAFSTEVGPRPFGAAVSPDGREVWVTSHGASRIDVVDARSGEVVDRIPAPPDPHDVAFSTDGRHAYVASHETDRLTVVDTRTRSRVATLDGGNGPYAVAVSPDGDRVAVAGFDGGELAIVDTLSDDRLATVPVGRHPQDVAWAPDGRHLYVVNADDGTVSVVDTRSYTVSATVPVGRTPTGVAVRPDGERAYVTNVDDGTVSVLDISAG